MLRVRGTSRNKGVILGTNISGRFRLDRYMVRTPKLNPRGGEERARAGLPLLRRPCT